MIPDTYAPATQGKGLCTYRLWIHKWTRWQREQVTGQYGEVTFWWYRSCMRCGVPQSNHAAIIKAPNSWPKYLK